MKITRLLVKNFKGIKYREFNLDARFTVFIGANASGKTTVLDALAVAASSYFLDFPGIASRPIRESEIRRETVNDQSRPQTPVVIEATGSVDQLPPITWRREIQNKNTTSKFAKNISTLGRKKLDISRTPVDERPEGVNDIFPVISYHGTGRLWAEHEAKHKDMAQIEGSVRAYTNCLSSKSTSKDFLLWFKTQEDSIRKFDRPRDIQHLDALKEAIAILLPEKRWQRMAYDNKEEDLVGIYEDENGRPNHLRFSMLSDGFRNLIGLAADLAFRCIQLNPQLGADVVRKTPGIVLIDELDLHLHPNWQRGIVEKLKQAFPLFQFIATTHSPFIVQSLKASELVSLDEEIFTEEPISMPLNAVVTDFMGVENIRSDDFDKRYLNAKAELRSMKTKGKDLTLDDYIALRKAAEEIVKHETNDPEYKAFLEIDHEGGNAATLIEGAEQAGGGKD